MPYHAAVGASWRVIHGSREREVPELARQGAMVGARPAASAEAQVLRHANARGLRACPDPCAAEADVFGWRSAAW
jgi:hypothetical protein